MKSKKEDLEFLNRVQSMRITELEKTVEALHDSKRALEDKIEALEDREDVLKQLHKKELQALKEEIKVYKEYVGNMKVTIKEVIDSEPQFDDPFVCRHIVYKHIKFIPGDYIIPITVSTSFKDRF